MTKKLSSIIISGFTACSMFAASSVMAQPMPSKTELSTTPTSIRQGLTESHAVSIESQQAEVAAPVVEKKAEAPKKAKKHSKKGKKSGNKKAKVKAQHESPSGN